MNSIRLFTLLKKECVRFLKVYNQTIISPVINALIFFVIFTTAFGGSVSGASYTAIVATGLIAMSALQAAYQNTQATITVAKLLGFNIHSRSATNALPPLSFTRPVKNLD